MSGKERGGKKNVSRRNFLRNAGFVIGGAASLGIGGLVLTGCETTPDCPTTGKPDPTTQTPSQVDTEYIGECICPDCDTRVPHPRGVPCRMVNCPKCGMSMGRGAV